MVFDCEEMDWLSAGLSSVLMCLGIWDKEQKPFCEMRISEKVFKKSRVCSRKFSAVQKRETQ